MESHYLRNKLMGAGIGIAAAFPGCGTYNAPPSLQVSEPDGTPVNTEGGHQLEGAGYDKVIVIPLDRNDLKAGIERFMVDASDVDGPGPLRGNFYPVHRDQQNPLDVRIESGINNESSIWWDIQLRWQGSQNIPRGTYLIAEGIMDDGINETFVGIYGAISRGGSSDLPQDGPQNPPQDNTPDDDQNGSTDDDGKPSLEDLLVNARIDFVDEQKNIIPDLTQLTSTNFRLRVSIPKTLRDRYGGLQGVSLHERSPGGFDSCIGVASYTDPVESEGGDMVHYDFSGTLVKPDGCTSNFEQIEANGEIAVPGGTVTVKDGIEVFLLD